MGRLVLIRHGQASYGQADYDRLSPTGEQQARALGPTLAALGLDALFVGPLRRQQQTAAFARETAELPAPTTLAELAEYPAFDMVRHLMPKLVEEDPELAVAASSRGASDRAFQRIISKWSRDEWQLENVERVHEFRARVETALTRAIGSASSGGTICVVTSAGPIGVAVGLVFGATAHHMIRASSTIRNASVSELKLRTHAFAWHPDKISLVTFNSTSHLSPDLVTEY